MRSFVVCALLLAVAAASAQAGAVRARSSHVQELQYTCDIKGIIKLGEDIVTNSIAVVLDVRTDVERTYNNVRACVNQYILNPDKLVDCATSDIETDVTSAISSVQQYVTYLKTSVNQLKTKLRQCEKL